MCLKEIGGVIFLYDLHPLVEPNKFISEAEPAEPVRTTQSDPEQASQMTQPSTEPVQSSSSSSDCIPGMFYFFF